MFTIRLLQFDVNVALAGLTYSQRKACSSSKAHVQLQELLIKFSLQFFIAITLLLF